MFLSCVFEMSSSRNVISIKVRQLVATAKRSAKSHQLYCRLELKPVKEHQLQILGFIQVFE